MTLLLIKERLFLFGEFALSKSQYLYNKSCLRAKSHLVLHWCLFNKKHYRIYNKLLYHD